MALSARGSEPAPSTEGLTRRPAHRAVTFPACPDETAARHLLARINAGACDFSPESPEHPARPLVLYGAGNLGRLARDHLRSVGLDFTMVVDRQADRLAGDPAWQGVELCLPEAVPHGVKETSLLAISVATSAYVPLEATLRAQGWTHVVPFYDLAEAFRDRHPLSNGWFSGPLDATELAATERALSGWDDDTSRAHHLQFLAWRRLREEWTFEGAPMPGCARFFIPEVLDHLGDSPVFLDAGAHHGSVLETFLDKTGGRFASALAVEPDAGNRAELARFVAGLDAQIAARIAISPLALDAEPGRRQFHSGLGYASQFSDTGTDRVETTTVDALCEQTGLAPTFIKLHLEGAERDALEGAGATIARHRPILAVTVYHNADGIWRTPAMMADLLDEGYRLLFRLHGWCGTGAVIYAVPTDRAA